MAKKIPVTPVPWPRPVLGIDKNNLDRIGAKEGDWVGVKYKGKKINIKIRERPKNVHWPDDLVWIGKNERDLLQLPDISKNTPDNPPPKETKLHIWKHFWPRGSDLFRIVFATITLVLTTIGAILQGILKMLPEPAPGVPADPLTFYIGATLVAFAILGAIGAWVTTVLQKQ
jgi:hypothetical protein